MPRVLKQNMGYDRRATRLVRTVLPQPRQRPIREDWEASFQTLDRSDIRREITSLTRLFSEIQSRIEKLSRACESLDSPVAKVAEARHEIEVMRPNRRLPRDLEPLEDLELPSPGAPPQAFSPFRVSACQEKSANSPLDWAAISRVDYAVARTWKRQLLALFPWRRRKRKAVRDRTVRPRLDVQ